MIEIKPIGKYLSQEENGFIVNDLSIEKIDEKWLPILETIVETYQAKLGENLVSVYLRGSVARNLAVDNISDLDTFALVKSTFSDKKIRWKMANFQSSTFQEIHNK
jgi:tRNA nucleotidyltransferase (CCA-adding enzyme)